MRTRRSTLLTAAAAVALGRPFLARGAEAHMLRFVPQADVTILDPLATTAYPTRDHGHMCWDTLYGMDAAFAVYPQLAAGHVAEDGGKRWTFTLREGPRFHDGEPVRAADAVASIRRWMPRDSHGQVLAQRLDDIRILDDRRFEIRLSRPFGPLLDAFAKPWSYPCFIYPERFARIDPTTPFTEVVGSGPYRFVASERISGAQVAYSKFDAYVPAPSGPVSLSAGPKIAWFERQEWKVIPDSATCAAALRSGELDWWETAPADLTPMLAKDRNVVLDHPDGNGIYAALRFNELHPPFDDPAARKALLPAVTQSDFMIAIAGENPTLWRDKVGAFPAGSPLACDVGMQVLTGPRDSDAARAALQAVGRGGAAVVALHATNVPSQDALMSVGVDMLQKCGLQVTDATSDWGTLLQRRTNKGEPQKGGWNVLIALFSASEFASPAGNVLLRGNGKDAWFGWPDAPKLETLRTAWFDEADPAAQKRLGAEIQAEFFEALPHIPLGQYLETTAYRRDLTDIRRGMVLPLNVRRT